LRQRVNPPHNLPRGGGEQLRVQQAFSNDLYETGAAFCITTYQALFSPISAFKKQNFPNGIIFDDAHVGERLIRDAFTLRISKELHPKLFSQVIEIVRPQFDELGKGPHLNYVLSEVGQQSVTLCPPSAARRCREQIITALKLADYKNTDLFFATVQLYEHLHHCAIFISPDHIEVTPPFIPTGAFPFLGEDTRRVYLSATLAYETDFVRGFGKNIPNRIEPDNDAGNGERLILLAGDFDDSADKISLAKIILSKHKLLIAVPSYFKAKPWANIVDAPPQKQFSEELNKFRNANSGAFILVSRIDGIDLPQDTCRVMLIDGAPLGASLMEQYLSQHLEISNLYSTKMASRITQLLGRINRGRSDYGAFILYGKDINVWMKKERNVALLPPLIRKQSILGQTLQKDIGRNKPSEIGDVVDQVLSRDAGWLKFYRDTVDGLEISNEVVEKIRRREEQLSTSAVAECRFMTHLWQEDIEGARKAILDVLDDTALADARLAGWYSIWLGMTYDNEGDKETSVAHYKKARSRLSYWLNVPFRNEGDLKAVEDGPKTILQERLLSVNHHGPQALGDLIAKLRIQARVLTKKDASSGEHEEAVRMFGELLGIDSSRPDNELGLGPDVLWADELQKYVLAFELKTKKSQPAKYNKEEIGQAHNHLQWVSEKYPNCKCDGLLIVGPAGACSKEASPSDTIYLVETAALQKRMEELTAKIDDTRGRTILERWTALKELGGFPEWQLEGWFKVLAATPFKTLPRF
jgi:hypothetical protein